MLLVSNNVLAATFVEMSKSQMNTAAYVSLDYKKLIEARFYLDNTHLKIYTLGVVLPAKKSQTTFGICSINGSSPGMAMIKRYNATKRLSAELTFVQQSFLELGSSIVSCNLLFSVFDTKIGPSVLVNKNTVITSLSVRHDF